MLKNFFTLALRNLFKRKLFSFINIFGLALGVSACMVILKYIDFETSYDDFHVNGKNLYRITRTVYQNNEKRIATITSTYGLGPALATEIPEVKRYIRTHPMYGGGVMIYQPPTGEALAFHEYAISIVDSTFLRAFTFKAVEGNPATALDDPNAMVITRSMAEKYFGKASPLGKTIRLTGTGWCNGDYTVTAVLENVPPNSHYWFNALVPSHNLFQSQQYKEDDGWKWNNFTTYVELNDPTNPATVSAKLPGFAKRHFDERLSESNTKTVMGLQPLRDIHLSPGLLHDGDATSYGMIYFFGLIAAFILFIAWINYINLSTARAMERAREVGIKKAVGAQRSLLVWQFFFESLLINVLGIGLAVGFAVLLLPLLGEIIGKPLAFDFSDPRLWFTLLFLFVTGSLASGAYPSLALSSFRITDVLKGRSEAKGFSLRKGLVVFQFSASLILIVGTFVVYRQIMFMRHQDKGLQTEQMLIVNGPSTLSFNASKQKLAIFKAELKKLPGVTRVATSAAIPGGGHNWGADVRKSGSQRSDSRDGSVVWVDPDFIDTYDIKFAAGRNFNPSIRSDMESVIINETALQAYGLGSAEQALSEQLIIGNDTVAILGVLKNYNWNSLKSDFVPFLLKADTISPTAVSILLAKGPVNSTVEAIGKLYKELIPGDPYSYYFLDESFNGQYRSDQQFGKIFGLFAILAVAISCLGLWGLAAFTTAQKLKEIGVRKVLGATTTSIVYLLSKQFLRLVLLAAAISLPMAWFGIDSWLQGFAFRIGLGWDLFLVPVLILAIVALSTVSLQVIRGAAINPAKVLRSE